MCDYVDELLCGNRVAVGIHRLAFVLGASACAEPGLVEEAAATGTSTRLGSGRGAHALAIEDGVECGSGSSASIC